jgi:roadblock/LC7 domain-containing protein
MTFSPWRLLGAAACIVAFACGDTSGPNLRVRGIHVLQGGADDTVQARPVLALTVQVRGEGGVPVPGAVVRFETNTTLPAMVFVSSITDNFFNTFAAITADDAARASVLLSHGFIAGPAEIIVTAPELGLADTVHITVLPGNADGMEFNVRDTLVAIGGSYTLQASLVDRFGNPRDEVASSVVNLTPAVCTLSGTQLTGTTMGRCIVAAQEGTIRDTARATVVPSGRMVALNSFFELALRSTDGSGNRSLFFTSHASLSPAWSPDGSMLVFYEGDPASNSQLFVSDTNGVRLTTVGGTQSFLGAATGRFSPDGQWVYFSGRATGNDPITIWRMRPDGTGREMMLASTQSFPVTQAWRPSVSPNGQTVAFDMNGIITLLDVATRQPTLLNVQGVAPSFSPDGQTIAYFGPDGSGLRLVNANGTNSRTVSNESFDEWQAPQWTSETNWIFAGVRFVNVSNGTVLPLTPLSYSQAALKAPLGR